MRRARRRRRWRMRWRGSGAEGMSGMIAFLALLIWLYLFFLHGRFWESGPELRAGAAGGIARMWISWCRRATRRRRSAR